MLREDTQPAGPHPERSLSFAAAINEATDLCMAADPSVYLIGEGVPDAKGIFGTTLGLQQRHGAHRVMDMPVSENALTGVVIGSCLAGMRPVLTHQRVDFALVSIDQIVNNAAKWHYMFGGQWSIPLVIRLIIGRGWGQGPQHAQSLQAWFAHIPGLKVVMPTTAYDAKGLLISSIEDNNPVIFLEHRWLHSVTGYVPEGSYRVPIGEARVVREGRDLTIVATSYMTLEALRAATMLADAGVSTEVVDVRTLRPLDRETILASVRRTGRLLVTDTANAFCGFSAEVVAQVTESAFESLKAAPVRVALPEGPSPSSPALSRHFYPRASDLARAAADLLDIRDRQWLIDLAKDSSVPLDVPDAFFRGPF